MTRIVEGVVTIVKGLRQAERRELIQQLLEQRLLTPDEQDALVIEARRGGPKRPLDEFVRDLRKKGRLH